MKFNFLTRRKNETLNFEGEKAFVMTPSYELYTTVVTTSLNDAFYENGQERLNRIIELIKKCDAAFVAKLAVYARTQMYMRSVPLVLIVELAKLHNGDALIAKMIKNVVLRADEITELLAYYQLSNNRNEVKKLGRLSKQIQKGLAYSFNQFDSYQFAKYNRATEVKIKDALFLVHPIAKDEAQQNIFNQIATDTLPQPYTWETELSILGQNKFSNLSEKENAFRQKWEELIFSGKLGYMALLRNLRNIILAKVAPEAIKKVCDYLTNVSSILNSKQFPFRYLSAFRELRNIDSDYTSMVLNALEDAILISAQNIKGFDYNTSVLVACDVSGSMQSAISRQSTVQYYDIGLMLGMLLQSKCERVTTGMFGDTFKMVHLPRKSVITNVESLRAREGEVGYSTNGYLVIADLINKNKYVDKIMLFTDCQLWDSRNGGNHLQAKWNIYKAMFPNAKLYIFDLLGYGKAPVNICQKDVYLIAGWSDKIFDILNSLENATTAIDVINQIEL